ncbi:DUF6210 family protein [Streptomyces sp. NPDC098781]|uniref:DUF6210 family protein n=1 Tax=Streptomyces sp. NPDC098781 TaxID=3366097 RepID=UPI0038168771
MASSQTRPCPAADPWGRKAVDPADGAPEDCRLFEKDFRGAGIRNRPWPDDERERLGRIVRDVTYWACDGHDEEPHDLRLDESRMREADEAWVPVRTPDGPGVLVWFNSD